jgi:hypothetical protein
LINNTNPQETGQGRRRTSNSVGRSFSVIIVATHSKYLKEKKKRKKEKKKKEKKKKRSNKDANLS